MVLIVNLGILAAFCRLLLRKRLSKSTAVDRCDTSDNNYYIFPYFIQKDQSIASNTNVDSGGGHDGTVELNISMCESWVWTLNRYTQNGPKQNCLGAHISWFLLVRIYPLLLYSQQSSYQTRHIFRHPYLRDGKSYDHHSCTIW